MGQKQKSSLIPEHDKVWVVVGRVGRPFGVRGWVHIQSFTEIPERLFEYPDWQLQRLGSALFSVKCESHKPHGQGQIAKFAGWETRDLAAAWTNADIVVHRDVLPELPEGEYYWQDLIGLAVYNLSNHYLGIVDGFFESKANDILIVKDREKNKETLIPYVPEAYGIQIDFDKKILLVDWPEDF
jgi:16S rRNA processing protein RimM